MATETAKVDDGGAAFPLVPCPGCDSFHKSVHEVSGMSLRDYFSGQALCGLLNKSQNTPCACTAPEDVATERADVAERIAAACYRFADAMLAARKPGGAAHV